MPYESVADREAREAKEARSADRAERAKADPNAGREAMRSGLDAAGVTLVDDPKKPDRDEKEAAAKIVADAKVELTKEKADARYARRAEERLNKLASKQKSVDEAGAALGKAQAELTAAGVEFDTKFEADNPQTQADIDYAAGVKAQADAANLRAGYPERLR